MPDANDIAFVARLRKPVQIMKDGEVSDVSELTFRKPTGGDIARCGNPIRFDPYGATPNDRVDIRADRMRDMMAALAGVTPQLTIDRLDSNDWSYIAWELVPFFLPTESKTT